MQTTVPSAHAARRQLSELALLGITTPAPPFHASVPSGRIFWTRVTCVPVLLSSNAA